MKGSSGKENILKKIRQALANPVPVPFPLSEGNSTVFTTSGKDLEVEFAENFAALSGRFSFCLDETELVEQLMALLKTRKFSNLYYNEPVIEALLAKGFNVPANGSLPDCEVAITGCEFLIARTGSIVLSSAQLGGRTASVYAPVHICVAYTSQLVYDIKDGLARMKAKYTRLPSFITFATGPSRTADIEKTLVVGVHGPKEVFVFLIDG